MTRRTSQQKSRTQCQQLGARLASNAVSNVDFVLSIGALVSVAACQSSPQAAQPAGSPVTATDASAVDGLEPKREVPSEHDQNEPWDLGCRDAKFILASADYALHSKVRGHLAITGLAPGGHLDLKEQAGAQATTLRPLAYNAGDLEATGHICKAGDGIWHQVRVDGGTGWLDGKHLVSATAATDQSEHIVKLIGNSASPKADSLALLLKNVLAQNLDAQGEEGRRETEVLGVVVTGDRAEAQVTSCCALDDSVSGSLTHLEMLHTSQGWELKKALIRHTCYRGTTNDGKLCN